MPKKITILVVDDEESIRELFKIFLAEMGHSVLVAANGQEALTIFAKEAEEIDLIFLDIVMPGISAIEVLSQVKETHPCIPVVMMSGMTEDDVSTLEIYSFISKPLEFESLGPIIEDALRSASEQDK